MTNQEWSNEHEKWSLQDLIDKGIELTREAQEGDALYRDQFIAVDAHNKFSIWRIALRDFLYREKYFEPINPLYSKVEPLLEADSVPMLKGGIEYGDPQSEKSQTLLRNIREETKRKLQILREVREVVGSIVGAKYDTKTQILLFKNKQIPIKGEDTNPVKLMSAIFSAPNRQWQNDEILTLWFGDKPDSRDWENAIKAKSIYQAGRAINSTIEKKTGIGDFLEITTKTVKIRNKYL